MPKRCGGLTKSDTETTLLKYVDTSMSRLPRGSLSSSSSEKMPKRCRGLTKSNTETTLLKYVDTSMSRLPRGSLSSSSSANDASSNSLFSNDRTLLSERTSSTVPPECPPRHDFRRCHNQTAHVPQPHRTLRAHNSSSHIRSEDSRTSSSRSPFLQRRCLIIMTIISVTASIVTCCFVALCLVYKLGPILDDNTFQEGDLEACVPCSKLSYAHAQTAVLRDFTVKVFPDRLQYYCARNTGQMSSLIQIIMNQVKSTKVLPQPRKRKVLSPASTPASTHKHLLPGNSTQSQGESKCENEPCQLKLDNTETSRQHNRLFSVHPDHMEIMYSGMYFVYSSIYIWSKGDLPCKQLLNQTFRHYVMRSRSASSNESGCLIETSHTCCDDCTDDYHTSYAAGVFELKKGDQVFVNVYGSSHVLFEGNGTYLGLVMLSSSSTSS